MNHLLLWITSHLWKLKRICCIFIQTLLFCLGRNICKMEQVNICTPLIVRLGYLYPGQGCQNGSKKFVRSLSCKHNEMSLFHLSNGFRLQKTNRATRRWKQPPKKLFYHVSRDKILHDSWSLSAALAARLSDPPFWTRRLWGRGWQGVFLKAPE